MRVRIIFEKTDAMRFTGHLDLHRTLERTLRRARLPLSYSQGYTPRAKIHLASALPLGFTSEHELADFWLDERLSLPEIEKRFVDASPPGVRLRQAWEADDALPSLQSDLRSAEYVVTLTEPIPDLADRVRATLEAESLPRTRRKKSYDLRPLILELSILEPDEAGRQRLHMHLTAQEGATGRADEVLKELGVEVAAARVRRTGLKFSST